MSFGSNEPPPFFIVWAPPLQPQPAIVMATIAASGRATKSSSWALHYDIYWIGLDCHWIALDCIGLHWIALDCIGLHWNAIGLGWIALD